MVHGLVIPTTLMFKRNTNMTIYQEKICSKCDTSKSLDMFYRDSLTEDGRQARCKTCRGKDRKESQKTLKYQENQKAYRQTEIFKKYQREYKRNLHLHNINAKISARLRIRTNHAIRGRFKPGSAIKDLSCSVEFLREYLESKWQPGMTWENYGVHGWHIDHIIPLDSFDLTDREQFLKAVHYTNLQPLWALDNILKGNRLS